MVAPDEGKIDVSQYNRDEVCLYLLELFSSKSPAKLFQCATWEKTPGLGQLFANIHVKYSKGHLTLPKSKNIIKIICPSSYYDTIGKLFGAFGTFCSIFKKILFWYWELRQ